VIKVNDASDLAKVIFKLKKAKKMAYICTISSIGLLLLLVAFVSLSFKRLKMHFEMTLFFYRLSKFLSN